MVIHALSNLVGKLLTFITKIPLCLVCIKNVELERKAEKFSRELTNGAKRSHFILEQTAQLISEAESNLNTDRGEMTVPLLRKTQVMVSFGEVQSCNENGYIIRGSGLA